MTSSFLKSSWLPSAAADGSNKKKPKDVSLYELLGVEYTVTEEELKRAYKKRALRLHPDKGGDPAEFDKMKRAYDVLRDEKKRQYYDRYGPKVLQAMEQGGPESAGLMVALLLSQKRYRALIFLAVLLLVGLVDLFPVLVSVKWDGAEWSWGLAFFPVFLVLGLALLGHLVGLGVVLRKKKSKSQGGGDATQEDAAGDGDDDELASPVQVLSGLVLVGLQLVFWAMFSAKLDAYQQASEWSWYYVAIPLAVFELWLVADRWAQMAVALHSMRALQQRVIRVAKENIARATADDGGEAQDEGAQFVVLEETDRIRHAEEVLKRVSVSRTYLFTSAVWPALRLCTWWLVAARAQRDLTDTWFVTAIPFIVGAALSPCIDACLAAAAGAATEEEEEPHSSAFGTWCSQSCLHCGWLLVWLLGMGKLDDVHVYSAFAIFSVWFALSAVLLLPGLSILCFNVEDMLGGDEEDEKPPQQQQQQQNEADDVEQQQPPVAAAAAPEPDKVIILT